MRKRNKLTINLAQWKNGVLDISDIECDSMDEAKKFIKSLKGKMKVKVYDENKRLQHSENVDNEDRDERHDRDEDSERRKRHQGHHHGHNDHDDDDEDSYH
jgi:hypothetical protein